MSPEQILGDKLDFRSDLFSLGIVLYQTLTGRKPFVEDDSRTVMQKIRLDRFTPPRKVNPKVPRALERILARCMEKMPANRYPATQALIDDLIEFLAQRVPMNHNSRLVMYLREVAFLTDAEAEEILAAAGTRGTGPRAHGDRRLAMESATVMGILFGAVILAGVAIQAAHGRFSEDSAEFRDPSRNPVVPAQAGYVRVVVEPWAVVSIDGEEVATTPYARPIALTPGLHFIKFSNPFCSDVDQEVRVRAGETQWIDVTLEPNHDPLTEATPERAAATVDP